MNRPKQFSLREPDLKLKDWEFWEVTLEDKEMFEAYIRKTSWPTNLWSSNFPYLWAEAQSPQKMILWRFVDNLIVPFLLTDKNKLMIFCLPFGQGDVETLVEVLDKALKFCSQYNGAASSKTKVRMINGLQLDFLKTSKRFDELFEITQMKAKEMHYSIEKLLSLKGNAFKSLRQKVKGFYKYYPEIKVRAYQPEDYEKVLSFNNYWELTVGKNYSNLLDTVYFKEIIKNYRQLDQLIFVAEVGQDIVGIVSGGILPTGEAWACLGKAHKNVDGLSEALLIRLIHKIKELNPTVKLINDGGDLASEGLRQYKEKFRPVLALERYRVLPKEVT